MKGEVLRLISVELLHNNCWTEITENYDVKVKLLKQEFNHDNSFSSKVVITGNDSKIFLREMKNCKDLAIENVSDVLGIGYLVDFVYNRKDATSKLFHKYNAIIVDHRILDGIERWIVLVNKGKISALKDELDKRGEVMKFKEINISSETSLSNKNLSILREAYLRGFFEYPRGVKIDDLSKYLGIKPNTLIYHIRKSEKAIIKLFLEDEYLFY
jgi:predicted DNA binding protein